MKIALLVLGLVLSTATNAQAIRKCTDEVLTCRLDKELYSGGKVFLAETSAKFSGFNDDEPSIEPDECTLTLSMEADNVIFNVSVGDSDYVANIFAVERPNLGLMLPGDAAFPIMTGKTFYYRTNKTIISCTLK